MVQKDYIMRIIEQFAKSLAKIAGYRVQQQHAEALENISEAFSLFVGLDSDMVAAMSDTELISLLKHDGVLDVRKCIFLAELLKEQGDVYDNQTESDDACDSRLKALSMYLAAWESDREIDFEQRLDKIEILQKRLRDYDLPSQTKHILFRFYDWAGLYSKAEDLLFDMLDDEIDHDRSINIGIEFYNRLLQRSDEELSDGGLPRGEVMEGLQQLEGM